MKRKIKIKWQMHNWKDKKYHIALAWECITIYKMMDYNPILQFLYFIKYVICVILERYKESDDYQYILISMSKQYPTYKNVTFGDPPDPAWDEHYVTRGIWYWYYTEIKGIT